METIELQPLIDNYHRKIAKISLRFNGIYMLKSIGMQES